MNIYPQKVAAGLYVAKRAHGASLVAEDCFKAQRTDIE